MPPNIPSGSRAPPKRADPVSHNNVQYSAPWDKMGYIEARDAKTEELLWDLQVYEVDVDPSLERDAQEIYITFLKITSQGLEVMTEAGTKYLVELKSKKVKDL